MNKQTILDPFFDASLGKGMFAPRLRTKYPSKRLQAVIKMFREAEARIRGEIVPERFGEMLADLEDDEPLRELDVNDNLQPGQVLTNPTAIKPKTTPAKRKRANTVEGDENAGVPKKRAPRKKKTQDSEAAADREDDDVPTTGDSTSVSKRGRKGKSASNRGGARGSKRTRTSRSETITQAQSAGAEPEGQNVTGMQPVSSPYAEQGYDELFLSIASDPIGPEDIAPIRPRPRPKQRAQE
jgi:hypothetical protein